MSFWKWFLEDSETPPAPAWHDAPEAVQAALTELVARFPPKKPGPEPPDVIMSFKAIDVVAMTEEDIKRERAEQRKSFRDHVRELLRTRFQGDRQAFYTAADLDRRLFSKIVSYAGYNPSKETALAIAVGARLTESEALDLLRVAGFNWNESSSSDIVYRACLRHQVYEWEHIRDFLKRFAR